VEAFCRLVSRVFVLGGSISFRLAALAYQPPQKKRVIPWFNDNGDKTHRLNYDLNENSVVLDLGGYEGQWASDIFAMYRCHIHVFEPIPQFANSIRQRFARNSAIRVHNCGLGEKEAAVEMRLAADGTSIFASGNEKVTAQLVDVVAFLRQATIGHVDLMKINIEGGEYDLLDRLISARLISRIRNIQVQFHDFVPDAARRMKRIQEALRHSHRPTYQYEFVWENWEAKEWPPIETSKVMGA
jgi:FkbM family methyltransferase